MTNDEGRRTVKKIMASSIARCAITNGVPPDDVLDKPFAKALVKACVEAFEAGGVVAVLAMTKRCSEIVAKAIKDSKNTS